MSTPERNGIAGVFYALPIALLLWGAILLAVFVPAARYVELGLFVTLCIFVYLEGGRRS